MTCIGAWNVHMERRLCESFLTLTFLPIKDKKDYFHSPGYFSPLPMSFNPPFLIIGLYTFSTRTFLPGTAAYMKKTQKPKLSWKLSVLIRNSINTAAVKLTNTTATHPRLVIQTAENGQDSNPQSFRNGLANHIFQATHEVRNSAFIAKIASRLQNSWTFLPIMPWILQKSNIQKGQKNGKKNVLPQFFEKSLLLTLAMYYTL